VGVIKSVLREELENAIKMKKGYEEMLKKHSGGSFIQKTIRGNKYYYLAYREGRRVKFIYKGKTLSKKDKDELKKSKSMRKNYKDNIRKLNVRIRYLRRVLRGKEDV